MTRATDARPTTRLLVGHDGEEIVVELHARRIVLRPKGARRGGPAERVVTPSRLYQWCVEADLLAARKTRVKVTRGHRIAR